MTVNGNYSPAKNRASSIAGDVYLVYLRPVLTLICTAVLIYFVVVTFRWPMIWDEIVMHYVNLLMAHGMAPYRDIYDMNLPGIYLVDGWQMHLFGAGDLAFRLYEFFLLGAMLVAMVAIAMPEDWFAGLLAGALFILSHAGDGPRNSAQRDEIIAVLLMAGYAVLFQAVRRNKPAFLLPFGVFVGFALNIKPTVAPLVIGLAMMALYVLKKRGEALFGYVIYGIIGLLIPAYFVLHFLLHYHAWPALIDLSTRLTPYYAGLMKESVLHLIHRSLDFQIEVITLFAMALALFDQEWVKKWERWAILLGVAGGLFSYVIQRKGYSYHKYPLLAFTLLWVCMQFACAIRKQVWTRWVGLAGLTYLAFYLVLLCPPINRTYQSEVAFTRSLQLDLTQLGGDKLQHQVQCLDMVDGCLSALYHLNLAQNTGFTGDTLFFVQDHAPAVDYYRSIFLADIQRSPPKIFVIANEWFNWQKDFNKIYNWPDFANFLNENYTLSETRTFSESSYRLYLLKSNSSPHL
jgi:hypothetical protein